VADRAQFAALRGGGAAAVRRRDREPQFKEMAAVLEDHMQGREFVAGTRVSVADFIAAYTLDWGNEAQLLGECPTLVAYLERMYQRPKAVTRIAEAFAQIGM